MKNLAKWAAIPLLLILAACAGSAARANVLLPALRESWAELRQSVVRQVAAEPDPMAEASLAGADEALRVGAAAQVAAVNWPSLARAVELDLARQLAAGQLGPLGVESPRALLAEFLENVATYTRAPQ